MRRSLLTGVVLLAGLVCLVACGSSDGNEDILDPGEPIPVLRATLTDDGVPASAAAPYIHMAETTTAATETLRIRVQAVGPQDLWAVAFTLTYDPSVIRFVGGSAENAGLLGSDSRVTVIAQLEAGTNDRLVVGATRRNVPGGDNSGISTSGAILNLDFRAEGPGTTILGFAGPPANLAAEDSQGDVIPAMDFYDAVVTVTEE